MRDSILKLLKGCDGFVSGEDISSTLGVTRAAVWKHINALKEEGYVIEASSRRGYRLASSPDILTYEEISGSLKTEFTGRNILHYDTIDSTNMKAKELAAGGCEEGTVVIAEEQTRGRGRLGRSWSSPKHRGIWMSIVLKPDISPARAAAITQVGAASVWRALSEMGIETLIKWPNDILAGGRKVCGILAEMSAEMNKVNYIIAGIGINVNTHPEEFPEELRGTAASLFTESMHEVSRKDLAAAVLNNFESLYREFIQTGNIDSSIEICKSHSATLGRDIRALSGESEIRGRAVDITPDGELMVMDEEGSLRKLFYGEVSVRGMNGYV